MLPGHTGHGYISQNSSVRSGGMEDGMQQLEGCVETGGGTGRQVKNHAGMGSWQAVGFVSSGDHLRRLKCQSL